jgi:hypothetical protein
VDGVHKVHPVAQNLAVAFAGSVVAGFTFAHDLAYWLGPPNPGYVVSPARVAWRWQRRMRRVWRELPNEARAGGCQLLLVGAWPSSASPAFANSDSYRFVAPGFELERLPRAKATSIGSGTGVGPYVEMLESLCGRLARARPVQYSALSRWAARPDEHGARRASNRLPRAHGQCAIRPLPRERQEDVDPHRHLATVRAFDPLHSSGHSRSLSFLPRSRDRRGGRHMFAPAHRG